MTNYDEYDPDGYACDPFDADGFDVSGRDVDGYDRDGFDINGYDRAGRTRFERGDLTDVAAFARQFCEIATDNGGLWWNCGNGTLIRLAREISRRLRVDFEAVLLALCKQDWDYVVWALPNRIDADHRWDVDTVAYAVARRVLEK